MFLSSVRQVRLKVSPPSWMRQAQKYEILLPVRRPSKPMFDLRGADQIPQKGQVAMRLEKSLQLIYRPSVQLDLWRKWHEIAIPCHP